MLLWNLTENFATNAFVQGRKNFQGLNKILTKNYHIPSKSHKNCNFHNDRFVSVWIQKVYMSKKALKQSFISNQKHWNELVFISRPPNKIIGYTLELEWANARGLRTAHFTH